MTASDRNVTAGTGSRAVRGGGTLFEGPRQPVRTCIGCGQRDYPHHLLRLAVHDGQIVADVNRRMGGRGAWLHPAISCLEAAERRRAFGRAFRKAVSGASSQLRLVINNHGLTATR